MKRLSVVAIAAVVVCSLMANNAEARKPYKDKFVELYGKNNALAKKATCATCHPTKSKKDRNDYGYALSKLVNPKNFKGSQAKLAANQQKLAAAFKKLEGEKNAAGEKFGALIKAGKLPGSKKAYKGK